jgi:hypothetical protein
VRIKLTKAAFAGILAGLVLGLLFKSIEQLTSLKVYTLLLNVDYIPLLNRINLSETMELILHLVISILLSMALAIYLRLKRLSQSRNIYFVIAVSLLIGLMLYPTTVLSERTPELTNIAAGLVWLIGHALYGWLLGLLLGE